RVDSFVENVQPDLGRPTRTDGAQALTQLLRLTLATCGVGAALMLGTPGAAAAAPVHRTVTVVAQTPVTAPVEHVPSSVELERRPRDRQAAVLF
ncbi:MAG: hypothetical protein ACJ72G_04590, partial [Friedmanniella sp.]